MVHRYDGTLIRYSSLKPVYMLNILDCPHFIGDDDALRVFSLYDRKRDKIFEIEYLTIAYFELMKEYVETANQRHWKIFLKTGEAPEDAPDYIKKAAWVIEKANLTKEEREMIDQLQKAKDIYDSVLYTAQIEGEKIGAAKGKIEGELVKALTIARNALHMGMTVADISQLTGLTENEIRNLTH